MKTLQQLYNEVINSEELKKEYNEAAKNGKALDFIRTHDVDTSSYEIIKERKKDRFSACPSVRPLYLSYIRIAR